MIEYPPKFGPVGVRLAFVGPMASGKTYIAENLFPIYEKFSLAGPLKTTARFYYGVTGKGNDERKILQELADDLKKWDGNVFTKLLLLGVKQYYDHYTTFGNTLHPVVVDDVRFPHEADDLRDYGFDIVRVTVPEELRMARIKEKYPDTDAARFLHPSETATENIREDIRVSGEDDQGLQFLKRLYNAQPSRN